MIGIIFFALASSKPVRTPIKYHFNGVPPPPCRFSFSVALRVSALCAFSAVLAAAPALRFMLRIVRSYRSHCNARLSQLAHT